MKETRIETIKKLILSNTKVYCKDENMAQEYTTAFYNQLIEEIINNNKEKYREEQQKVLMEEKAKIKISETKKLIYEGFFIAFFIGVSVNQSTDLIGILKGNVDSQITTSTLLWLILNLIICGGLFFFKYIQECVKYFKK